MQPDKASAATIGSKNARANRTGTIPHNEIAPVLHRLWLTKGFQRRAGGRLSLPRRGRFGSHLAKQDGSRGGVISPHGHRLNGETVTPPAREFPSRSTLPLQRRVRTRAYAETPTPIGHDTPVPPRPQWPAGFLARYCWW